MAKKVKKKELGLGIRALLSNIEEEPKEKKTEVVKELSHSVAMIPISQINANPEQPRKEFADEPLNELVNSIKMHGIIQPLTLRRLDDTSYQLISGERRLRASKLVGLKEVPAYIRIANDQEMLEMALIENIQREELNAMEIAFTYNRLMQEFNLTHDKLADRVGKKRSTVSNYLTLLNLAPSIQTALKNRQISVGHAKALNGVKDISLQLALLTQIIENGLSVREVERLAKGTSTPKPKAQKPSLPAAYMDVQEKLRHRLASKVELKLKSKGKGQILINFNNTEDLNRILDILDND